MAQPPPTHKVSSAPGPAWATRASELAQWAWRLLVNRTDAWGGYRPLADVGRAYVGRDGLTHKLGSQTTHKGRLTAEVLRRHFEGRCRADVVGLHSTSRVNTSRWGTLDIDWHGPTSCLPAVNLAAALAYYGRLRDDGFSPLLTDSNGAGGFHLGVLFREPVPTARLFAYLQRLTADFSELGLPSRPEFFPKQQRILAGRFGNWLRLPGRHHRRDHWSRVWDGSAWLDAGAAVDYLLGIEGDDPGLLPTVPAAQARQSKGPRPEAAVGLGGRIEGYIARLPAGLGEGMHRDDFGFQLACFLVRDLALPDGAALPWLETWDGRNAVPKGRARLLELIASAHAYGRRPYGCGLTRPRARPKSPAHPVTHIRFSVEF